MLGRSSYAVLGAVGLAGTATYFIEKWFSLGSLVPYFAAEPESVDKWGRPLVYLALGAVFVALGIVIGISRATLRLRLSIPRLFRISSRVGQLAGAVRHRRQASPGDRLQPVVRARHVGSRLRSHENRRPRPAGSVP